MTLRNKNTSSCRNVLKLLYEAKFRNNIHEYHLNLIFKRILGTIGFITAGNCKSSPYDYYLRV